jgi:hypothetical protein
MIDWEIKIDDLFVARNPNKLCGSSFPTSLIAVNIKPDRLGRRAYGDPSGYTGPWHFTDHELRTLYQKKDEPVKDELDELIKKVNDGKDALRKLYHEYSGKYQYSGGTSSRILGNGKSGVGDTFNYNGTQAYIEKVQELKLPFTMTANGYGVCLAGGYLKIGCRNIPLHDAKNALQAMCRNLGTGYVPYREKLDASDSYVATRYGIAHTGDLTHVLQWADADALLIAIEKAGL